MQYPSIVCSVLTKSTASICPSCFAFTQVHEAFLSLQTFYSCCSSTAVLSKGLKHRVYFYCQKIRTSSYHQLLIWFALFLKVHNSEIGVMYFYFRECILQLEKEKPSWLWTSIVKDIGYLYSFILKAFFLERKVLQVINLVCVALLSSHCVWYCWACGFVIFLKNMRVNVQMAISYKHK